MEIFHIISVTDGKKKNHLWMSVIHSLVYGYSPLWGLSEINTMSLFAGFCIWIAELAEKTCEITCKPTAPY